MFHNGWLPFGAPLAFGAPAAFVFGNGDENSGAAFVGVPFAEVPVVFHGGGANS